MQKMHRTAGATFRTLTVGDRTFTARPPKAGWVAGMEAYIVSLRENPLVTAVKAKHELPEELRGEVAEIAAAAMRTHNLVTAADMQEFQRSLRGLAWMLFICIRQDHEKELSDVDAVLELLEPLDEEQLEVLMVDLQGIDGSEDLGNSSGREATGEAGETSDPTPTGPAVPAGQ